MLLSNYVTINGSLIQTLIDINDKIITDIIFKAQGDIPKHNPGINWGYGIITVDELGRQNVIATERSSLKYHISYFQY